MNVAVYARVSSEEQAREGYSIANQLRACRLYCELHQLGDVREFVEPGLSGRDTNRPAFQELMKAIRSGTIEHLVVWRMNRLHRNLRQFLDSIALLEAHDVQLHSITEHVDTKSATGRLLVNILASFHAFESDKLAEDVKAGTRQKIREGGWANHAPRGYQMEHGTLVVDPEQGERVREAFRRAAEGQRLRELGSFLEAHPQSVLYMLTNPVYAGYVYEGRNRLPDAPRTHARLSEAEGVVLGVHEALVSAELWDRVQIERSRVRQAPGDKSRHLFSGILKCSCKAPAEIAYPGNRKVYRCAGTPRCHSVSAARLEATLLLHLDDLQTDPRFTDAIRSELQARIKAMEAKVGEGLAAARRQLKDVERQEARWRKLYMREKISEDTYLEEAPSLEAQRWELELRVGVLESGPERAKEDLAAFEQQALSLLRLPRISELWDHWSDPERAVVIRELVESMVMEKTHLVVKAHGMPAVRLPYAELRGRGPKTPAAANGTGEKVSRIRSRRVGLDKIPTLTS